MVILWITLIVGFLIVVFILSNILKVLGRIEELLTKYLNR